jgi:hypothetical protein
MPSCLRPFAARSVSSTWNPRPAVLVWAMVVLLELGLTTLRVWQLWDAPYRARVRLREGTAICDDRVRNQTLGATYRSGPSSRQGCPPAS